MNAFLAVFSIALAYAIGGVPSGLVMGKINGVDVRHHGSGGTGATNTLRLLGWKVAVSVFVMDFMKGFLPVLAMRWFDAPNWAIGGVAVATVLGHCWSPYIGFTGGKGMATGGGAAVGLAWWFVLLLLPMIGIVALTRYVSLASLIAAVAGSMLALGFSAWGNMPWGWSLAVCMIAGIAIVQHRANIGRLLKGTERKFGNRESAGASSAS